MKMSFGETLRRLRIAKGLSQQQLAAKLYVDRSTIAHWEIDRRQPDAAMIARLARCLNVDAAVLMSAAEQSDVRPNVIMLDDEKIILSGGLSILRTVMPDAQIAGFTRPSQALAYARANPVALAFLDIEMGRVSGLDVCRELLALRPQTNVVYLTAYRDYSFDAWSTGACGFLLKPLTVDTVRELLARLRYPIGRRELP